MKFGVRVLDWMEKTTSFLWQHVFDEWFGQWSSTWERYRSMLRERGALELWSCGALCKLVGKLFRNSDNYIRCEGDVLDHNERNMETVGSWCMSIPHSWPHQIMFPNLVGHTQSNRRLPWLHDIGGSIFRCRILRHKSRTCERLFPPFFHRRLHVKSSKTKGLTNELSTPESDKAFALIRATTTMFCKYGFPFALHYRSRQLILEAIVHDGIVLTW
jgi:hypothetical protein